MTITPLLNSFTPLKIKSIFVSWGSRSFLAWLLPLHCSSLSTSGHHLHFPYASFSLYSLPLCLRYSAPFSAQVNSWLSFKIWHSSPRKIFLFPDTDLMTLCCTLIASWGVYWHLCLLLTSRGWVPGSRPFISMLVEPSTRLPLHWLSQLLHHAKVEQHCGVDNIKGFKQERDRNTKSCQHTLIQPIFINHPSMSCPVLRDRYKMITPLPMMKSCLKLQLESHQALEVLTSLQDIQDPEEHI